MKNKKLSILMLFFLNISFAQNINKIQFEYKDQGFYRSITDFIIINDKIIICDFFRGRVYCYKYSNGRAVFLYEIGRPGQGPGDIEKPFAVSAYDDFISIKDQQGISTFKIDGQFLSKFRTFSPYIAFVLIKDKIYYLNANMISNFLIDVFDLNGKLCFQFGEKSFSQNRNEIDSLNSFREFLIYDGFLLTDDNYLYYINNRFGTLDKYSLSGKKIITVNLIEKLDENAKVKVNINKNKLIKPQYLILDKGRAGEKSLFMDAYIDSDYIYLLMDQYDAIYNKSTDLVDIKRVSINNFKVSSFYSHKLYKKERLSNIAVKSVNEGILILLDIDSEEGLNIYEIFLSKINRS